MAAAAAGESSALLPEGAEPIVATEEEAAAASHADSSDALTDEEWVMKTPVTQYWPRRWSVVVFTLTADLICYMDRANLSVTIIPMARLYGWSKPFQGLAFSAFFIGLVMSHMIGGHLADTYGGKLVLTMGVFWWSVFTYITPDVAPWPWLFLLCRFGLGVGEGVNFPCVFNLFSRWFPAHEKDLLVTIAQNGVYLGTIIAMVIVPVIEHLYSWETVFYLFGVIGILWAVFFYWFGASRPNLHPTIDPREQRYIEATCVKESAEHVPWVDIIRSSAVWALALAKFGYYYAFFLVLSWQPTYYYELGMPRDVAAYVSALPFVTTVIFVVSAGWLASALQERGFSLSSVRKALAFVSLGGNAVGFLVLAYIRNAWTALAVMCAIFALNGAFVAGVAVNVLDLGPKYAGSIMAFTHTVSTLSGVASSLITGSLLTKRGDFGAAYLVTAAVNFVATVAYVTWSKHEVVFE